MDAPRGILPRSHDSHCPASAAWRATACRGGAEVRIEGCSALVTGAASGLGLATATALHAAGAAVVLLDLPGAPGAAIVAALGGRARFVAGGGKSAR
ncbi:MAG: SDR family NAD(P)-dependent oxidoreductase, partial [Burkholderiaceae bacterium]|nr:SDR family NAD(P)-dependent oxidoreductase [Microbacteriaceae bacterium]